MTTLGRREVLGTAPVRPAPGRRRVLVLRVTAVLAPGRAGLHGHRDAAVRLGADLGLGRATVHRPDVVRRRARPDLRPARHLDPQAARVPRRRGAPAGVGAPGAPGIRSAGRAHRRRLRVGGLESRRTGRSGGARRRRDVVLVLGWVLTPQRGPRQLSRRPAELAQRRARPRARARGMDRPGRSRAGGELAALAAGLVAGGASRCCWACCGWTTPTSRA